MDPSTLRRKGHGGGIPVIARQRATPVADIKIAEQRSCRSGAFTSVGQVSVKFEPSWRAFVRGAARS
jgi:hypothetical protein